MRVTHYRAGAIVLALSLTVVSHRTFAAASDVEVPVDRAWTETDVDLRQGETFHVDADGVAKMIRKHPLEYIFGVDYDRSIGPAGTYIWPRDYAARWPRSLHATFPLPAGNDGPWPGFGLIGRIGPDGEPFYVGKRYDGEASRAGRLWLGINDPYLRDNRGTFHAHITLDTSAPPEPTPRPLVDAGGSGRPIRRARVLLLYVDGLRPDVVHEMAALGFLPNIQSRFLDGGLECVNAFSTFPSNTLVANGALFTGRLPSGTGIKSQNQFERTTLKPRGQISELMPDWMLARATSRPRVEDLLDKFAPENTEHFLRHQGIPTLGSRLGPAYKFTILPIAPTNPPLQWLHRALNTVRNPFIAGTTVPQQLDVIDARYVTEELLGDPDAQVIAAWFPMTDKICHFNGRGQFGPARREIARFDREFGRMLKRMRQIGWTDSTYLILVSDHGHLGGEQAINRRANLAADFFYRELGCNVKVVGQVWRHPGNLPGQFVFLDNQGAGQAAIFLPKGSYHRGAWKMNTYAELTAYDFGPNVGRVNLLEALTQFTGPEWQRGTAKPVDLVLVKLDPTRVLVYRSAQQQAVIETVVGTDGEDRYRYTPVRGVRQGSDGELALEPIDTDDDPLHLFGDRGFRQAIQPLTAAEWSRRPHDAQEWLRATAPTEYPDAIVGMASAFAWKKPLQHLAAARDPDILVTAARGWLFRSDDLHGTDHGYPLRESMRISLFVAGPNIRRGSYLQPCRIIDVMPTMLDMIGRPANPKDVDGRPLQGIYE